MTPEDRDKIFDKLFDSCKQLLQTKGVDYAGEADCLSNFKRNAERLHLSKYQVWAVYFSKHIDSVMNAIDKSPVYPKPESEGLGGRMVDIVNYVGLLRCMMQEDEILLGQTSFVDHA